MSENARTTRVRHCESCPANEEDHRCNLALDLFVGNEPVHPAFYGEPIPAWCPLRDGPWTIVLATDQEAAR